MKDAVSNANKSVWRWLIQRIRVAWLSLVMAVVFLVLAFMAHPESRLTLWLARITYVLSGFLALLQAAYAIRFGKKLD